jgi:hypothetical protein
MAFENKLKLPDIIDTGRINRFVYIDNGIEEVIQYLWSKEIQTRGCCSGHGKENPSIVIAEGYTDEEVEKIKEMIYEKDSIRDWDIYQWKLIKI